MRKLLFIILLLVFPAVAFAKVEYSINTGSDFSAQFYAGSNLESNDYEEEIRNMKVDIEIRKDGTLEVAEIIVYDFGSNDRHGIFRTIPTVKKNMDGRKYRLDISDISVKDEKGNNYRFVKTYEGALDDLKLKIGDPDKTITGLHTYVITYKVSGALTYFSGYDELYWNVTGNDWQIPIEKVQTSVILPDAIDASQIKSACFSGVKGSTEQSCIKKIENNKSEFQTSRTLNPQEGFTIVFGFPKNLVAVLEPKPVISFWETIWGKLTIAGLALLAIVWYLIFPVKIILDWWKRGRDPSASSGQVRAWFDPPETKSGRLMAPAEVGALIDETVNMRDISATIVDLGRRGYLKIEERKKNDFYLIKTKEFVNDMTLRLFEKELLKGIFKSKTEIRIKDRNLYPTVQSVNEILYNVVVEEGWFEKNPQSVRNLYYILAGIALFTGNIFLALAAFIFGHNMPRKTLEGVNSANTAKSLKNFLTSQERQLQFQAENQLLFEKLLPFAVVFGVEKIWADRFKDISLQPPEWYSGYSHGRFSSVYFVNSLNSSFSSVSAASAPPKSSSGFSGGSSGGGGGGGGGRSW